MKFYAPIFAILALVAGCTITIPDQDDDDSSSAADDDSAATDDDDATTPPEQDDDDATTPPPGPQDEDEDGYSTVLDCNDANDSIHPGAAEVDNDLDDDCDGEVDEGFGSPDQDGDGYSAAPDCDDSDPNVFPGATENCEDGIDNDCDTLVDEDDEDDCPVTFDGHEVTITVAYASASPAIDFSFGYCSDQANPANCNAWNQSVVTATNASSVSFTVQNVTTGAVRANSSRFYQASDWSGSAWINADSWLCEQGPVMTGSVSIAIDGLQVVEGQDVYCMNWGNGASLGIEVAPLIAQVD